MEPATQPSPGEAFVHLRTLYQRVSQVNTKSDVERMLQELSNVNKYGQYGWVHGTVMLLQKLKEKSIFVETAQLIIQACGSQLYALPDEFNKELLQISNYLASCRFKWVSCESIANFYESERLVKVRKMKPKVLLKSELAQKNQRIAQLEQEKRDILSGLGRIESSVNENSYAQINRAAFASQLPSDLTPFFRWLLVLLDAMRSCQPITPPVPPTPVFPWEELHRLRDLASAIDIFLANKVRMNQTIETSLTLAKTNRGDEIDIFVTPQFVAPVPEFIRDFVIGILNNLHSYVMSDIKKTPAYNAVQAFLAKNIALQQELQRAGDALDVAALIRERDKVYFEEIPAIRQFMYFILDSVRFHVENVKRLKPGETLPALRTQIWNEANGLNVEALQALERHENLTAIPTEWQEFVSYLISWIRAHADNFTRKTREVTRLSPGDTLPALRTRIWNEANGLNVEALQTLERVENLTAIPTEWQDFVSYLISWIRAHADNTSRKSREITRLSPGTTLPALRQQIQDAAECYSVSRLKDLEKHENLSQVASEWRDFVSYLISWIRYYAQEEHKTRELNDSSSIIAKRSVDRLHQNTVGRVFEMIGLRI